jgi:alcohol dehydrogenase class IV
MLGQHSSLQLCKLIAGYGFERILLVTDKDICALGLHEGCLEQLQSSGCTVHVFNDVSPNPTVAQIESVIPLARNFRCNAVLAVGGGSPIDVAKVVAAAVTNHMPVAEMEGAFKLKNQPVPIFVVPTTAGTGSDATVAAAVIDTEEQRKYVIADMKLAPQVAALDPLLMRSMPPHITAATGMDALTHGIEAFISKRGNEKYKRTARVAIKLIFDNLPKAYREGVNLDARESMAFAAFQAGIALNGAGLGYVHAISHKIGALYDLPHGLSNAIVLPHVLDASREAAASELADLCVLVGLGNTGEPTQVLADRFIDGVRDLISEVDIPTTLDVIQTDDAAKIYQEAQNEVMSLYAVPKYFSEREVELLVEKLVNN